MENLNALVLEGNEGTQLMHHIATLSCQRQNCQAAMMPSLEHVTLRRRLSGRVMAHELGSV